MTLNKLSDYLITEDDLLDLDEIIDVFDLVALQKALGDENYFSMMHIMFNLSDAESRIRFIGSLDRLLHTNYSDLIQFDEKRPFLRSESISGSKGKVLVDTVNFRICNPLTKFSERSSIMSSYHIVTSTLALLCNLDAHHKQNKAFDEELELPKSFKPIKEAIKKTGKSIPELIDNFDKLEKVHLSNENEKLEKILFQDEVSKDYVSLIEIVSEL